MSGVKIRGGEGEIQLGENHAKPEIEKPLVDFLGIYLERGWEEAKDADKELFDFNRDQEGNLSAFSDTFQQIIRRKRLDIKEVEKMIDQEGKFLDQNMAIFELMVNKSIKNLTVMKKEAFLKAQTQQMHTISGELPNNEPQMVVPIFSSADTKNPGRLGEKILLVTNIVKYALLQKIKRPAEGGVTVEGPIAGISHNPDDVFNDEEFNQIENELDGYSPDKDFIIGLRAFYFDELPRLLLLQAAKDALAKYKELLKNPPTETAE